MSQVWWLQPIQGVKHDAILSSTEPQEGRDFGVIISPTPFAGNLLVSTCMLLVVGCSLPPKVSHWIGHGLALSGLQSVQAHCQDESWRNILLLGSPRGLRRGPRCVPSVSNLWSFSALTESPRVLIQTLPSQGCVEFVALHGCLAPLHTAQCMCRSVLLPMDI